MNFQKKKLWVLQFLFLAACSSCSDKRIHATLAFPELGSMVRTNPGKWNTPREQIGVPLWENPIKVTVQELPFSKASYKKYAYYRTRIDKKSPVVAWDSLESHPTYLRLQLEDKIDLAARINRDSNAKVRAYIAKDPNAKLVTSVNGVVSDTLLSVFRKAGFVLLTQDTYKNINLLVMNEKQHRVIPLHAIAVFGVMESSFCWGTDRYGTITVENLASAGQKCPEGTYTKASEVNRDKSYFKL